MYTADERVTHRLSMLDGPDEHTPPFCECGAWWPCPEAPKDQPLEEWERELAEAVFADISERPCSTCGATETVEVFSDDDSMLICAECGSDEP